MQTWPVPDGDYDALIVGEALVDLISTAPASSLSEAQTFTRYAGGSPANIANTLARLGKRVALGAKVGADALGRFLKSTLLAAGVDGTYLRTDPRFHTSLVLVTRTAGTPDFDVFREADYHLTPEDVPPLVTERARLVHASSWPLSREPARSLVEALFVRAQAAGKWISLDPNYSPKVWLHPEEAQEVMRHFMRYVTLTKPSLDDAARLFGPDLTPEAYLDRFHAMGPRLVVLTMGVQGMWLSVDGERLFLPAQPVEVVDATGAGDAFWAGFLTAMVEGNPLDLCLHFAREVVGLKLRTLGPFAGALDKQALYCRARSSSGEEGKRPGKPGAW